MLGEHISKQYDADLQSLRARVLQMGALVGAQISQAVDALTLRDIGLAGAVIERDVDIDALEVSIDEDCVHIIACRQPVCSDLRLLMAVTKILTNLERIGDEAEKIAHMAKRIHESDQLFISRFTKVKRMCEMVRTMLKDALDAFAHLNLDTAARVVHQDDRVDQNFRAIIRELIINMMENPRTISTSIDMLFIAKALERIGDHAKNVAEHAITLVKGKNMQHLSFKEIESELKQ